MLVARTAERESISIDGMMWWKEWHYADGWIGLVYLDRNASGWVQERSRDRWVEGATLRAAIREGLGDTSFFTAESVRPEHAEEVAKLRVERAAATAKRDAEKRLEAAREALEAFKVHEQRLFNKRHGHKQGPAYTKALEQTQKRLAGEYQRLQDAVGEARTYLELNFPT